MVQIKITLERITLKTIIITGIKSIFFRSHIEEHPPFEKSPYEWETSNI
jgi:hypothetical protein